MNCSQDIVSHNQLRPIRLVLGSVIGIFIISIALITPTVLNGDSHWLLYMADQVIAGAKPYVEIIEVNPPLAVWIHYPAIWLKNASGLTLSASFKMTVYLAITCSLILSFCILRRVMFAPVNIVYIALAFALLVLPAEDFGQREHLIIILGLPYILIAVARSEFVTIPFWLVVISGILAGIGFCIKPHYLLIPLALELYLLARLGFGSFRRLEPYIMGLIGFAYAASIFLFTPEYINEVVGYTSFVYQSSLGGSAAHVARQFFPVFLMLVIAGLYLRMLKEDSFEVPPTYIVLFLAMAAGIMGYFLQFKGWSNHLLPGAALVFAITAGLAGIAFQSRNRLAFKLVCLAALAFPVIGLGIKSQFRLSTHSPRADFFQREITKYQGVDTILIMSATLHDGFPLINDTGLKWASRFSSLWFTPGLQKMRMEGETGKRIDEIETFTHEAVAEDITRFKPQIVFVRTSRQMLHFEGIEGYDFVQDFSRNTEFANEWANYTKVDQNEFWDIYRRSES